MSVRLMNFRTVSHLDVIITGGSLGHVMALYKLPREISCTFQITAVSSYCKINDSSYIVKFLLHKVGDIGDEQKFCMRAKCPLSGCASFSLNGKARLSTATKNTY